MTKSTFNQPCYTLVAFSENIWVHFPQCSKHALVTTQLPTYTIPFPSGYKSSICCSFCAFKAMEHDKRVSKDQSPWFGYMRGYVEQACMCCGGKNIRYTTKPTKNIVDSVNIECSGCNNRRAYEISWFRCRDNVITDPYFGFDLYLTVTIRDKVLWVYNLEHLDYLTDYVQAALREDSDRFKYAMIANLPQWIKASKNRALIVRKLNKLRTVFVKELKQQ